MDKETKTLHERLSEVQDKLKAPKSNWNSFSSFHYRSCEDILEAVKPLLKEQGLVLTLTDELSNIGDRYYVRAIAQLRVESGDSWMDVNAYAREDEVKKGMDGSQITGTASSYARKYALNGLFLIDDTKDADTDEHHVQTAPSADTPSTSAQATKVPARPAVARQVTPQDFETPHDTNLVGNYPSCPKCGGEMWDNRERKLNPKAPDFKCKDKNCDGVIWPPKNNPDDFQAQTTQEAVDEMDSLYQQEVS